MSGASRATCFSWYTNVDLQKCEQAYNLAPKDSTHGHYSDAYLAFIVDFANNLGIEIIPEVDIPGHMGAAIRAYPELGDLALRDLPAKEWPHRNDVLWPSKHSQDFLHAAFSKICDLFPSSIIHVGADEVNLGAWEADTHLMQVLKKHEINSGSQFQAVFISNMASFVAAKDQRLGMWDDALAHPDSPINTDTVVTAWQEKGGVERANRSGHEWIFADAAYLYLNRVGGPVDAEPAGMFGPIGIANIFEAPVPDSDKLLGIQAAVWCEFISKKQTLF